MKPMLGAVLLGGLLLSGCAVPSGAAVDRVALEGFRADACQGAAIAIAQAGVWASQPRPAERLQKAEAIRVSLETFCDPSAQATVSGNAFIAAQTGRLVAIAK